MVSLHITIGRRTGDPFNVEAEKIEQLPADDRDLGLVDTVGTEDRAAAALGALVKVVPPFPQHIEAKLTGAGHLAQDLSGRGEFFPIDRADQFGAEDRHILGITGADEEMAFVSAGAAAHADVHEEPE